MGLPGRDLGADESGSVILQSSFVEFSQGALGLSESPEAFDHFGQVLTTGDWNGDGQPDLALGVPDEDLADGAPGEAVDGGTIHVLFNQSGDPGTAAHQTWNWNRPDLPVGALDGDRFGGALAAGDFDDDGVDDLAIGVPGAIWNEQAGTGIVQILYGEAKLLFADNFEIGGTGAWSGGAP
jgi:hypothetical protein